MCLSLVTKIIGSRKIAADNFPYAYKNWLILVREREEIKEQLMED